MKGSKIQTEILQWAEAMGYYAVNIISASKSGTHDVVMCAEGLFFAIEVKGKGDTEKKLQATKGKRVRNAGGVYFIARDLDDVIQIVQARLGQ